MVLMVYSGARGTLIYEKNLKSKFSCQTPFNISFSPTSFVFSSLPFLSISLSSIPFYLYILPVSCFPFFFFSCLFPFFFLLPTPIYITAIILALFLLSSLLLPSFLFSFLFLSFFFIISIFPSPFLSFSHSFLPLFLLPLSLDLATPTMSKSQLPTCYLSAHSLKEKLCRLLSYGEGGGRLSRWPHMSRCQKFPF